MFTLIFDCEKPPEWSGVSDQTWLNSGFKPEPNLIEIMNPLDEGMFGWFTVNFLLDQFENVKGDLSGSHVSLDLGGGSTQITFAPMNPNIAGIEGRKHFKHSVNVLGEDYQVIG